MSIAIQSTVDEGPTIDSTSSTFSLTPGTGVRRKLVVAVMGEDDTDVTISSVTYNGVALTLATNSDLKFGNGNKNYASWYFLDDADFPASAEDLVVTWSAETNGHWVVASFLTDAAQGQPDVVATGGVLATTTITVNYTPTVAPGLAMMNGTKGNGLPSPWNAENQTLEFEDETNLGPAFGAQVQSETYADTSANSMNTGVGANPFRLGISIIAIEEALASVGVDKFFLLFDEC